VDRVSPEKRSWQMSRVRQRDTAPEMIVRRTTYALGYRYLLHDRRLPGSPDLVFRSRRKVIFVHGCFWHRHKNCPLASTPKTRSEFWKAKFEVNQARDHRVITALYELGWSALIIWQCEAAPGSRLERRISDFLGQPAIKRRQTSTHTT
jgi:DNA mismatch endonuclease, patch repair protein